MLHKIYSKVICCVIFILLIANQVKAQQAFLSENNSEKVYYNDILYVIVVLSTSGFLFFAYQYYKLKKNMESIHHQKIELEKKKEEITKQDKELAWRNEEIASQNEELLQIQQELMQQKKYIEEKNWELNKFNRRLISNEQVMLKAVKKLKEKEKIIKDQNEKLEEAVKERTAELSQKNQELIDYTNQLEQFAFVTGHNLRAPIARLLGLVSIMDLENFSNPENKIYIKNLEVVTKELDAIIIDLNTVLEVKRADGIKLEDVSMKEKTNKVTLFMKQVYNNIDFEIYTDFREINEIQSINIYWESILYNLISNSIKYRHPDRPCEISIETSLLDDTFTLEVKDNGLGIDLESHADKVFGLYKRFHQHVDGKGLGLHLVKLQVESLGGKISVESKLNEFTRFTIVIPHITKTQKAPNLI